MAKLSLLLSRISIDEAQASQISTLIVYLSNEKTDSEDYFSELESLITTLNTRCSDKLAIVRRWAKRAICDQRFTIGKLLNYMMTDSDLKDLTSRVQSAVDSKDFGAIDNLAF